MRAIVCSSYGSPAAVLELKDIDRPKIGEGDVLVRVRAAAINPADWHVVRGEPYIARVSVGVRKPKHKVPGCDLAGRVEAVGPSVVTLQPGDEVYGSSPDTGWGAFAEYARVPADRLAKKPINLSFLHAAAVPLAAMTALQALRDHGGVIPGSRVLIVGAAGGVGSFAVQIAKLLGAKVTAVCSTGNVNLVRSLGADQVVDYTRQDFTTAHRRYDLVIHLGGLRSLSEYRRVLASGGILLLLSGESTRRWLGPVGRILRAVALSPFVEHRLLTFTVNPLSADLQYLATLIEAGELAPVIDRTYPLAEVPAAISYVEEGHTRGKVAISL